MTSCEDLEVGLNTPHELLNVIPRAKHLGGWCCFGRGWWKAMLAGSLDQVSAEALYVFFNL